MPSEPPPVIDLCSDFGVTGALASEPKPRLRSGWDWLLSWPQFCCWSASGGSGDRSADRMTGECSGAVDIRRLDRGVAVDLGERHGVFRWYDLPRALRWRCSRR